MVRRLWGAQGRAHRELLEEAERPNRVYAMARELAEAGQPDQMQEFLRQQGKEMWGRLADLFALASVGTPRAMGRKAFTDAAKTMSKAVLLEDVDETFVFRIPVIWQLGKIWSRYKCYPFKPNPE